MRARPPRDAVRRDWGNAAVDPVRGLVFYFGGGHSTYQVNDVAVYAVGANRWVHAGGGNNDFVPPVGWGGVAMGFRGGRHAHHQRNSYVALDGRMYVHAGYPVYPARYQGDRPVGYAWFYDLDRGGVWRWQKVRETIVDKGIDQPIGDVHVVDPAGLVIGVSGLPAGYYSANYKTRHISIYDIYARRLVVRKVEKPYPERVGECRPFCCLADRKQVFFFEYRAERKTGKVLRRGTWLYDLETNRFTNLKPPREPEGMPLVVEYIEGQNAVLAVIHCRGKGVEQWVYSLERNRWAPLPLKAEGKRLPQFQRPYGQMLYVARYGVLVNLPGTWLMRPDVKAAEWEK